MMKFFFVFLFATSVYADYDLKKINSSKFEDLSKKLQNPKNAEFDKLYDKNVAENWIDATVSSTYNTLNFVNFDFAARDYFFFNYVYKACDSNKDLFEQIASFVITNESRTGDSSSNLAISSYIYKGIREMLLKSAKDYFADSSNLKDFYNGIKKEDKLIEKFKKADPNKIKEILDAVKRLKASFACMKNNDYLETDILSKRQTVDFPFNEYIEKDVVEICKFSFIKEKVSINNNTFTKNIMFAYRRSREGGDNLLQAWIDVSDDFIGLLNEYLNNKKN